MRTQVAIIGAGPAGMFLAHLLHRAGIDAVVLEQRSRPYVEGRMRAGVLEDTTVALIEELGLGVRMRREGLTHRGTNIAFDGGLFHLDMSALTGCAGIMVYGQSEVMKDLNEGAEARGVTVIYNAEDVSLHEVDTSRPLVRWRRNGRSEELGCDFVAGCDGSHGTSRNVMPAAKVQTFERVYPFGWLGILADVPPCNPELVYANHENGFALASMRSLSRSRYYLQCPLDVQIEDWPDERFWDELCVRLGPAVAPHVVRGTSFEKSVAPLRSFVSEPMRWGSLFLAGDAAHIVPPTGAKGLNLAASDVRFLAEGLIAHYKQADPAALDAYSARALARVWKAERFSWWFTGLTHRFPDMDPFARRMQLAELNYIFSSRAAQTTLAENYVGLPLN